MISLQPKMLRKVEPPKKLILSNFQSPGDIIMLTAAIRDLHRAYPGKFATDVRTPCPALFENSPYITRISDNDPDALKIPMEYPLVHRSNTSPYHFIHGFRMYLEETLKLMIPATDFKGDIHLTSEEKSWLSQVDEVTGVPNTNFWIIISGGKNDFTAKWWDPDRCQEIVDHYQGKIQFVQCGSIEDGKIAHDHPALNGVIDMRGKTNLRQMIRLMYHAQGVVCPVTMFMHLAAAVDVKPGRPLNRPCVVVAGGREPSQWEAYTQHQYLHVNGCLPCCDNGGCWASRVVKLNDGSDKDNSICMKPTLLKSGRIIPKCLDMITSQDVIRAIDKYQEWSPK